MTSLEGIVVTSSTDWTLELLIQQFKSLCDRVTVAVDLDSPQSREILQLTESLEVSNIVPIHVGGYIELVIQRLYNQAKCDWVIRLDDDELVSDGLVSKLNYYTDGIKDYYHLARAHIVSLLPYQYISDNRKFGSPEMWVDYWENWQLRLFKKGHCIHHGKVHEGPEGKGNGGLFNPDGPILHYNLLKPRKERERIVQKYRTVGGDDDIRGDSLLWEDFHLTPVSCPYKPWIPN